jgi:hypothetical protein
MKRITGLQIVTVTLILLSFLSCKRENQEVPAAELEGKWELEQAYRDGKETNTLESLYFEIIDDSNMGTNFFGRDEIWAVLIENGQIIKVDGPDVVFDIVEHTDQKLGLSTKFKEYEFRFDLVRKREKNE